MAKRKRWRQQMTDGHVDPRSPLLEPLCRQHAHDLLARARPLGAVEAVTMVMVPTSDGGADIVKTYAWPLAQGGPSKLMLDAMRHEIDCTRKEIQ